MSLVESEPAGEPRQHPGRRLEPGLEGNASTRRAVRPPPRRRVGAGGMRQTLQGSFSAVSKRNFASKYAFESSRRDLHNALLCTAIKSHFFHKNSRFCQKLRNVSEILLDLENFAIFNFWWAKF